MTEQLKSDVEISDEQLKKELDNARLSIGTVLSQTEMRSMKYPVLYDILNKIKGLLY